jgi:hypothetical protein
VTGRPSSRALRLEGLGRGVAVAVAVGVGVAVGVTVGAAGGPRKTGVCVWTCG